MNTMSRKVLDNGEAVVNLKRKQLDRGSIASVGAIRALLPQWSPPTTPDVNVAKRMKLEGLKSKNGSCAFPSGKRLLKYYSNIKKSGIMQRLMYHYNDEWNDFAQDIVTTVNKDFIVKKSAVEVEVNGNMILLDLLQMILLDMSTGLHQPIAWIDVSGKCFFPETFSHSDVPIGAEDLETQEPNKIKLNVEIEIQNLDDNSSGESFPIVVNVQANENTALEDCADEVNSLVKTSDVEVDEDCEDYQQLEGNILQAVNLVDGSLTSHAVRELFFRGISSVAAKIIEIRACTSTMMKGRLELFKKQAVITKKYRGDANVQYAWLPCSSVTVSAILKYGIGHHDQYKINPSHGNGVHLIPTNGAQISCFDVDENGTRHMVLCRVIMGNMELIHCGSDQFLPSSEHFDSGVDRFQNPNLYVVWDINMSSHIYPECVVSFRVASDVEEPACGKEEKVGNPQFSSYEGPQTQVLVGESVQAKRTFTPKSTWMPFPVLFAAIADKVTSESLDLVRTNYALFKDKKMTRDAFVTKLRLIVGDNLLKSAITSLQSKVWPLITATNFLRAEKKILLFLPGSLPDSPEANPLYFLYPGLTGLAK